MPGQVVTSIAQATGRGIFIIYKALVNTVLAIGTGRACMVCQLPWGPSDLETAYLDPTTFRNTFVPDGFPRTGGAYLMATKFPWIDLQVVRVAPTGSAVASVTIQNVTPANEFQVQGLYQGAQGNNITITIAAATDAVAAHFNMTAAITDSTTGLNTTETYVNVDSTQPAGAYWTNLTTTANSPTNPGQVSKLIKVTKLLTLRPVNGTYPLGVTGTNVGAFLLGSDGAVTSANYLGTQGASDHGVAVLEQDQITSFVFTDDVGAGLLSAVNTGLVSHRNYMLDRRFVILQGLPGEVSATAITNAAANSNDHAIYVNPHCTVNNDAGVTATIPLTAAMASLATALTPHLSVAVKNRALTTVLQNITGLDVAIANKTVKASLEAGGVVVFEKNANGVFSPYDDTTTVPGINIFARRMADYIEFSVADALENFRNGPNDPETFDDERTLIRGFLDLLKANRGRDHIFLPSILDFELIPIASNNSTATIAAGDATHGVRVALIAEQKRIFLVGEIGQSVVINVQSAV